MRGRLLRRCSQGETLGIVGESGCGKSTLGRCILQLMKPDRGHGHLFRRGADRGCRGTSCASGASGLQVIFQDPLASLNPRMTVGDIITDPLRIVLPEDVEIRAAGARRSASWTRSASCRR